MGAQERTLALLEANLDAGLIDIAQVDQFRQSIETERANLLQAQNGLENSMEGFKSGIMGLPPDLPVNLDDSMIEPFQLIDPDTNDVQDSVALFIESFGKLPRTPEVDDLIESFDRLPTLMIRIRRVFKQVETDINRLEAIADSREQFMSPGERKQFIEDRDKLQESAATVVKAFQAIIEHQKKLKAGLTNDNRKETADEFVGLLTDLANVTSELSLIQARTRLESVTLDAIQLSPQSALEIARANRLDWMNNRASLVDTWRLIEFNANALESGLNINIDGDIGTIGDNPARFRAPAGTIGGGIEFDAPLTRLIERNNFRQQLINYQQSRRQLIQFEDGVSRSLRALLRQLKQLQVNLEIQRRSVAIAIRRVDQTRETLNRPVPPAIGGAPPAQFGPTAALNLLTALSDLRSSQNNFMSVWLNYYAARMRLMRELGIMRVDERGIWIEESLENAVRLDGEDYELPPAIPPELLEAPPKPN
ncbi:MAG: hypothetical protein CMJ78_27495, partial [Planctomycetaceae bacterium]|nr:hypothetical protein [Planctomycetaceae bacterium]